MSTPLIHERIRRLSLAAQRARDVWEGDREARDGAIEEGEQLGLTLRELADLSGLTVQRVHAIVLERTAERQARLRRAAGLE